MCRKKRQRTRFRFNKFLQSTGCGIIIINAAFVYKQFYAFFSLFFCIRVYFVPDVLRRALFRQRECSVNFVQNYDA